MLPDGGAVNGRSNHSKPLPAESFGTRPHHPVVQRWHSELLVATTLANTITVLDGESREVSGRGCQSGLVHGHCARNRLLLKATRW